jgi:Ca-activated chloride channel family protein
MGVYTALKAAPPEVGATPMRLSRPILAAIAMAGVALSQNVIQPMAGFSSIVIYGKVNLEDGSPPPKAVIIERTCTDGTQPDNVGITDKLGRFTWKMELDFSQQRKCSIKGILQGYFSSRYEIPLLTAFSDPHLPALVLTQKGSNSELEILDDEAHIPGPAQAAWGRAMKAIGTNHLPEAERQLSLVVKSSPNFSRGWNALALVQEHENKPAEAWKGYRKAIELDPKLLGAYVPLASLSIEVKDWESADQVSTDLIKRDPQGRYPEARLIQASARYELKNLDGAIASANETIRLDKSHKLPAAEYMLALSLEAKGEHTAARDHLKSYLALLPQRAPNAEVIRELIDQMDKAIASGAPSPMLPPAPEAVVGAMELASTGVPGEAWVPGGRKALAQAIGLKDVPSYNDFFTEYCRALAREMTVGTSQGIPGYLTTLRTYMATVTDLLPLGERDANNTTAITISLTNDAERKAAEHVLALLGWKLVSKDNAFTVEPSDQPSDGPRQQIPRILGIDEVTMQQALETGMSFRFEIQSEYARVVGGNDWSAILKQLPSIPGGIAAAFTLDVRVAKAYAGLGAMSPDTAAAVIRAVGMSNLVLHDSEALARFGEALALSKGADAKVLAAAPGGVEAEPVWKKLVGASPRDPQAFFRALLEKNEGRLAAFYFAVWSADPAHQRYVTRTEARAERFYAWYRDSDDFKYGLIRYIPGWRTELLQKLPLDSPGKDADSTVHFPGGRRAWVANSSAPDDDVLLGLKTLEALAPLAQMEQRRGAPLDEASVTLLAEHYGEWKSLFPYFEKLPSLGHDEFTSLQAFAAIVSKQPAARQNLVLGEWYSMVELIARGYRAGSLDGPASARAFRTVCDGSSADDHAAKALGALRQIAGGPNLTEGVANLLRLSPERRDAFQRVLELQSVPRVDAEAAAPDASRAVAALSGFVYAASVDPDALLISEDPRLLSRHQFVTAESNDKRPLAFAPTALVGSNSPPGSFLKGGFVNFEDVARGFASGGRSVPPIARSETTKSDPKRDPTKPGPSGLLASTDIAPAEVVFRTSGRLVEAYATVTDSRGKYIDDLTGDQFTLLEQQQPQTILAFESHATPVSVALLLDTTGSMTMALPALKNAALKLIGDLRPVDSVAVYSFNKSVTELQPFTTDMNQAKRAVLSTQALGETALYDALARVARDLSGRPGKKVIVVFTDGDDNSSTLTTDVALLRVKATGVPLYTIAQGEALTNPAYLKQLADLSKSTGGESFAIHDSSEIGGVFEKVSEDLSHGYLLVFQPPPAEDHAWHPITIQVRGSRGSKVRAREGYYPE